MLFSVQSLTQAPTVYQPSPIPPFCDYSYLTFPFSYPRLLAKLILQAITEKLLFPLQSAES